MSKVKKQVLLYNSKPTVFFTIKKLLGLTPKHSPLTVPDVSTALSVYIIGNDCYPNYIDMNEDDYNELNRLLVKTNEKRIYFRGILVRKKQL